MPALGAGRDRPGQGTLGRGTPLARQNRLLTLYRQAGAWLARLALRDNDQDYLPDWLDQWHWCRRQYGEQLLPEEWLAYAWVQRHLGQRDKAWQIQQSLQAQAQAQGNRRLLVDALLLHAALLQDRAPATTPCSASNRRCNWPAPTASANCCSMKVTSAWRPCANCCCPRCANAWACRPQRPCAST